MLEKVAIFIIFLGPLVFFHELGHFFFARFFGVRVEVFSIGFGPKLFSFKRGDTQYAFSLIPLGGYVKMFGDDPLSEEKLSPEDEAVAYTKKSKWARFCIVFGGPLANFILAFAIYFSLVTVGENVPQTRFGVIPSSHELFEAGFRSGDVLNKINNHEIVSFDDLNLVDSEIKSITVSRGGEAKKLPYKSRGIAFVQEFSKLNPQLLAPIVVDKNGTMFIVSNGTLDLKKISSFEEIKAQNPTKVTLSRIEADKLESLNYDKLKIANEVTPVVINSDLVTDLNDKGFYTRDLWINSIVRSSPASKAGIKRGDILLSIDGVKLKSFYDLKSKIQSLKKEVKINIDVLNKDGIRTLSLTPEFKELNGKKLLLIGIYPGAMASPIKMVTVKSSGFMNSISKAYQRTVDGTIKTVLGFKKLITAEVSLKNIGGPIAIGKVASDSFNVSLSMFFRLMAIISINLGVINLFPIPVLDGGHIVFIILETINRGPLSRKKLLYAQQFGMSLLFLLIFVSLFNDVTRLF